MHKYQERIVSLFRKEPNRVFSTGDILKELGFEVFGSEKALNLEQKRKQVREKAKMHRAVLYHLNLLVSESILKVSGKGLKGEKFFELNLEQGEELTINLRKKHLKITKPQAPELAIKQFEELNVVERLGAENWIYKMNSVMFECSAAKSIEELESQVEDAVSLVNDAVALNDFDFLLRKSSKEELIRFCDALESYGRDFNKKFSFIVSGFSAELLQFIEGFAKKGYMHIFLIFSSDSKQMHEARKDAEKIFKVLSEHSITINILNMGVHNAPVFLGDFGVYAISKDDWQKYSQKQKLNCFVVSQASLKVDLEKFYQNSGLKIENFIKFLSKCLEALLTANTLQRTNAPDYFDSLVSINRDSAMHSFDLGMNYIRFANFRNLNEKLDKDFDLFLFKKIDEALKQYSASEETIFISCGMPARFRVSASLIDGEPLAINSVNDFNAKETEMLLKKHEEFSAVFPAELNFAVKRNGEPKPEEIFNELSHIVNGYSIPFISYSFKKTKGSNLKLTDFV